MVKKDGHHQLTVFATGPAGAVCGLLFFILRIVSYGDVIDNP
jgi:hypothetical protein